MNGRLQSEQPTSPGLVVVVVVVVVVLVVVVDVVVLVNELLSLDIITYIIITTIHMSESLLCSVSVCIDEP